MGQLIEYHIPAAFPLQAPLPIPAQRGRVIEFQHVEAVTVDEQPVSSEPRSSWIFVAPPR
jgi:hypothetical protein